MGRSAPGSYRATPVQERFWLLHEMHPESPLCNETIVLRIAGPLEPARLQLALNQMVARHDALRTRFVEYEGVLEAEVAAESTECPQSYVDLLDSSEGAADADPAESLDRAARERFDLTRAPLIRATLIRLEARLHILLLVAHHVAIDGRSMFDLLPRELGLRYAGSAEIVVRDEHPALVSYAEFARQARDAESGEAATRDLEYWRSLLDGAPGVLSLPVDSHHPPRPSMRGIHVERRLAPDLRARVQTVAAELGVRAFDLTCAAFVAQLMRYSGKLDLVLGSPIANRGKEDRLDPLIGCCIDTQLLRPRFDDPPAFAAIARAIHAQRRQSYAHRSLSFGTLLDELSGARDPARNPLYQAMFNYMDFSVADVVFPGLEVQAARRALGTSMLDLSLDVTEEAGGYLLSLEANADVFDAPHVERMLGHFVALLGHALSDPETELGALQLLDAREQSLVTELSRGPALAEPEPRLFHAELWQRARAFAQATALRSDRTVLSYAMLYQRVAELARRLLDSGVQPGDFVIVRTMPDPVDSVVGILGVLSAGGAFVPLDSSHPAPRQRALVEDSGARFLVSESEAHARTLDAPLVHVPIHPRRTPDPRESARDALPQLPDVPGLRAEHPAYLLYTSGSTGRPKGVIVTHANLTHQLRARLARYDEPPSRMLAPYSFAFDSSLASLSWTLAVGGELRLLSEEDRHDLACMRGVIARERVTHLDVVPSLYAALLDGGGPRPFPDLRVVICGGEALPAAVVRRHWEVLPDTRLFNEYGPTEATVFASVHEIPRSVVEPNSPIGRPIPNCQCWVFDAFGAQAPLGHSGELLIGGSGVAKGYHDRVQETHERFMSHALAPQPGAKLYRTGDRVRYREDGLLEFLGRVDDQVQIRGHRVELGEIEEALCRLANVSSAAVVLREDGRGDARLYAYVVIEPGANADATVALESMASSLRAVLPSYMVPNVFVPMTSLPRSSNDKIDRNALPVVISGVHAPSAYVAPNTALERDLIAIFQEVLGGSTLGTRDNFFDLGGHSLLAVKLVDVIAKRTGRRISLADFVSEPTALAVARLLEGEGRAPGRNRSLEVIHAQGQGVAFVFVGSVGQARLLSQHLAPTRPMFGLNLFGLYEPGQPPEVDMERVVDAYLKELRSVRPRGPYAIAGYCEDAKIAIAMARKLKDDGEHVPLLALIDAVFSLATLIGPVQRGTPGSVSRRPRGLEAISRQLNRITRSVKQRYYHARRLLARSEHRIRQSLGLHMPLVLEHRLFFASYLEALANFRHPTISGDVALYLASEWGFSDEQLQRAKGVAVSQIPSSHELMFEGHQLVQLAAAVQRDLVSADAAVGAA